jgi:hypothetical protein
LGAGFQSCAKEILVLQAEKINALADKRALGLRDKVLNLLLPLPEDKSSEELLLRLIEFRIIAYALKLVRESPSERSHKPEIVFN